LHVHEHLALGDPVGDLQRLVAERPPERALEVPRAPHLAERDQEIADAGLCEPRPEEPDRE
jgi:hypothetical protein